MKFWPLLRGAAALLFVALVVVSCLDGGTAPASSGPRAAPSFVR